jgi:hypothetical protein
MRRAGLLALLGLVAAAGCVPVSSHHGQVLDDGGAAVAGASIRVSPTGAPAALATLYDAAGVRMPNPFSADADGRYFFRTFSGSYNIDVSAPGFSRTLVNVAIVDPRQAHAVTGSNDQPPLTLVETSTVATGGNAALVLERRRADGTRLYAPWSLHVNKGQASRPAELRWLYNTDWNEAAQSATGRVMADAAYSLTLAPRGFSLAGAQQQPFSFTFERATAGAAGTAPSWVQVFRQDQANLPNLGVYSITRVGTGPFVVGDGLPSSSLIARRVGWDTYHTTAPAGVLTPVSSVGPVLSPGEVVVPESSPDGYPMPVRSDQYAQVEASVYLRGGNGTLPSMLHVGKALVRVASGLSAAPGDTIVSSGVEPGRATVDNTVTDPRSIIGFALESSGATLPGYVAIVRSSR